MSLITDDIKGILTIKLKTRIDSCSDQFHRIFLSKIAMMASFLLAINWLKDTMSCIVPENHEIDKGYISQACWIQGYFVYKDLLHNQGTFGYHGIPINIAHDGYYPEYNQDGNTVFCKVEESNPHCVPMKKTFYLQYQWFPFYMAFLSLLYYIPYIFYRHYNTDIISLRTCLKSPNIDVQGIINNYFNRNKKPVLTMRRIVAVNLFIKIFYVLVNVLAFFGTNELLNGDFLTYGIEWLKWKSLPDDVEYDYTSSQGGGLVNPSTKLLPSFGLCQVLNMGRDIKHNIYNKHQFVCEISQNIIYQYVLLILWFVFAIGEAISTLGFIVELLYHLFTCCAFMVQGETGRKIYWMLTIRECEYLECIRKKDMTIYGEIVKLLKDRVTSNYSFVNVKNGKESYDAFVQFENPYDESEKLLRNMKRKDSFYDEPDSKPKRNNFCCSKSVG